MTGAVRRDGANHYRWGGDGEGWRLLERPGLAVIEERVPAGSGEVWHVHDAATQFFYVLSGEAVLHTADRLVPLASGDGCEVPPGTPHRFANESADEVRFLVISAPPTAGDRRQVPTPERDAPLAD